MKQSPKLPAAKRRAQLIRAAGTVFAQKGYDGATTEDIAHRAGVTKGALYFHFKSKEDIFLSVVKEQTDYHLGRILGYLEGARTFDLVLEDVVRMHFKLLKDQKHFTIEFWQQASKLPRVKNYISQTHRRAVGEFAAYIQKHSGLSRNEAASLVWVMHAIGDGMLVQKYCYMGQVNQKNIINQIIDMYKLYLRKKN